MPIKISENELIKTNLPSNETSKANDVLSKLNKDDDLCGALENAKMVVSKLEEKCQDLIDENKKINTDLGN